MIDQVVSSIIEAEDRAKFIIEEAEKQSANIVSDAEQKAEKDIALLESQDKTYFSDKMHSADGVARKAHLDYVEQNSKTVDKEIADYRKNNDKAVKYILEQIL